MALYYFGELGYEADGEFSSQKQAEEAALKSSLEKGTVAISIWDEFDEVIAVAIDGEIFDKRKG